jgi:hypothetical protein
MECWLLAALLAYGSCTEPVLSHLPRSEPIVVDIPMPDYGRLVRKVTIGRRVRYFVTYNGTTCETGRILQVRLPGGLIPVQIPIPE